MNRRLVGPLVPYVPLTIRIGRAVESFEALLDTGFDNDFVIPESLLASLGAPAGYLSFPFPDGSTVDCPAFVGTVEIDSLGAFRAEIVALGDECQMGLRLANRFRITLDHGREIVVEP